MYKILAIFIITSLISGLNSVFVKLTVLEIPPILTVFLRFFFAMIVLAPFALRSKFVFRKNYLGYILLTGLMFTANVTLFAIGMQHTSVIASQVIYTPTGLVVALLGYLFLREKLTKHQIIGLVFSILGMAILIWGSLETQDVRSFGKPTANLLIVIALFFWSSYLVLSRKLSNIYSPFLITSISFVLASLISFPLALWELNVKNFTFYDFTMQAVVGVASLVFLSSILFYLLYQWVIKHTTAFVSSLVIYVSFIFATIFGIVFFSERLTSTFILGAVLILSGVFIATTYQHLKYK